MGLVGLIVEHKGLKRAVPRGTGSEVGLTLGIRANATVSAGSGGVWCRTLINWPADKRCFLASSGIPTNPAIAGLKGYPCCIGGLCAAESPPRGAIVGTNPLGIERKPVPPSN